MIVTTAAPHVPVLRPMRALLVVFGVLTLLAVAALFVRPETTDRYFAWTIKPPVTAAFLGAAYLAGCTLVVLSLRAVAWAHARAAVVTILVFTVLTLVATVVHLDRFHLQVDRPAARGWCRSGWPPRSPSPRGTCPGCASPRSPTWCSAWPSSRSCCATPGASTGAPPPPGCTWRSSCWSPRPRPPASGSPLEADRERPRQARP